MRSTPRLPDCGNDGGSISVTIIRLEWDYFDPVDGCWMYNKGPKSTTFLLHTRLYLKQSGNGQIALKKEK